METEKGTNEVLTSKRAQGQGSHRRGEEDAKKGKGRELLACLCAERKVRFKIKKNTARRFQMGKIF